MEYLVRARVVRGAGGAWSTFDIPAFVNCWLYVGYKLVSYCGLKFPMWDLP